MPDSAVAIIGLAGRFPGAPDVATYWANLRAGVEAISTLTEDELLAAGVDVARLREPGYVARRGVLADPDRVAPALFGVTPREAQITDPPHRLFLEGAWRALGDGG